jgi:hypothetical protein
VLCGFFGRGNAGDEAFLHAQHKFLRKEFDIIVALDRNAVRQDCVEWEPYRSCERWSYDEFGRVFDEPLLHGVHIGGGSLPFGFAGQFVLTALDAGKAIVLSGVDATLRTRSPGYELRRIVYSQMNLVAVRNEHHFKALRKLSTGMLGADWALGLEVEPTGEPIDVAMTIRESGELTEEQLEAYRRVIKYLEGHGRRVTFVPFAPEDDALLDRMMVSQKRREVHWHDPRTVQGRIAMANLVFSLGRLHTLIMAVHAGKAAVSIDPGVIRGGQLKKNHKNRLAAETFGLKHYDSSDAFVNEAPNLNAIEAHGIPEDYQKRFERMTKLVMEAFVNHKVPSRLPKDIPIKQAKQFWAEQRAHGQAKERSEYSIVDSKTTCGPPIRDASS